MLTKNELNWLEDRKNWFKRDGAYYCKWCSSRSLCAVKKGCCASIYSGEESYKDAAEFEALTVEVMSWFPRGKICGSDCPYNDKCREEDCSRAEIRNARLIAEEDD